MTTMKTTTAALALALSAFLAHGVAAQTSTDDTKPTNPPSTYNTGSSGSTTSSTDTTSTTGTNSMNSTSTTPSTSTTSSSSTTTNPSSSTYTSSSNGTALSASGKVVNKTADQVIVETDSGQRLTFVTDSSTSYPATWAVGDRVTVSYTTPSTGKNHADTIVMLTAPGGSYAPSTSTTTSTSTTDNTATTSGTNTTSGTSTSTLPKTASTLPLTLALGSLAGLAAAALHLARRG
jgi:hypothetical protein